MWMGGQEEGRSGQVTEEINESVENKRTEQKTGSGLTPGFDGCDAVRKAQHPKNQQQQQVSLSNLSSPSQLCPFKQRK